MSSKVQCRVCGKEYTPCRSLLYNPSVFNWREVACSPQCGQIYLDRIIASRAPVEEAPASAEVTIEEAPKKAARKKRTVKKESE